MAEIKLSDGTLIKTVETIAELRAQVTVAHKFMPVKDGDGTDYEINTNQIVFMSDD